MTRQLSHAILPASPVLDPVAAREAGIPVEERAFTVEEAKSAAEAIVTSATQLVQRCEDRRPPVGDGKPGPLSKRLRKIYIDYHLAHLI